jgi:Fe-Mn family superoxide dismutase
MQSTLPYDQSALEPYISAETLSYHYDKHHRGYIDKLNKLIDGTPYAELSLEDIIVQAREDAAVDILNNALQAWNHAFLWESMSPNGGSKPDGRIKELVEDSFGDLKTFRDRFKKAALSHFGSGWVWLVLDGAKLRILTTANADSPVGTRMVPLMTLDVWEHAYYIDYRNDRTGYVDTFLDKLVNWKFAATNLVNVEARNAA